MAFHCLLTHRQKTSAMLWQDEKDSQIKQDLSHDLPAWTVRLVLGEILANHTKQEHLSIAGSIRYWTRQKKHLLQPYTFGDEVPLPSSSFARRSKRSLPTRFSSKIQDIRSLSKITTNIRRSSSNLWCSLPGPS